MSKAAQNSSHNAPANPKTSDVAETPSGASNREKDPSDWVTGEEPMTGAQASYLKTLCEQAGEAFDPKVNKAQASSRIDALRNKTGLAQKGA